MKNLRIVEYSDYGDHEPDISKVNFIEVKTKDGNEEYEIHSIWYGPVYIDVSKVKSELMRNPVQYIEFIKSKGYQKLETRKIRIGK